MVYNKQEFFDTEEKYMSEEKVYKVFVVNPGSTSTKVEFFENEKSVVYNKKCKY